MAVLSLGCGSDKENAPPLPAVRGIAVKGRMMKRPGGCSKALRRPPLRDITRLFVTDTCPPPSAVQLELSDAALPEAPRAGAGAGAGASDGVTVKQGKLSLRKGFR